MKQTLAALLAAVTLSTTAFAQTHRPNVIQRHSGAAGVAAGVATHHALKKSAAAKKRAHRKLSFAERHPTLSGIAAGLATKKLIRKTTHH